jgi:hypothetical protein
MRCSPRLYETTNCQRTPDIAARQGMIAVFLPQRLVIGQQHTDLRE